MNAKTAWLYAASWGSFMHSGDPGACMYGFSEDCRPQSEEHRANVLAYIGCHCRPRVLERPADFPRDELRQMDRFVAFIAAAPALNAAEVA